MVDFRACPIKKSEEIKLTITMILSKNIFWLRLQWEMNPAHALTFVTQVSDPLPKVMAGASMPLVNSLDEIMIVSFF